MEETEETNDKKPESIHVQSDGCTCSECQQKRKYVSIFDMDQYVASLNDWD